MQRKTPNTLTMKKSDIFTGLLGLAAAMSSPNLEAKKPTREEVLRRVCQPEAKKPMTKEQRRKRTQSKAARKARSVQHKIAKR